MSDIVERLETEAKLPGADKWMLQEAADIIKRLTAEIRDGKSQSKAAIKELRAEIERLKAALEPFVRNVDAVSLSATLGHITREDLWRARRRRGPRAMSRERELIARIEGRMDKGWRRVTFEGAELDVLLKALRDMADNERLEAALTDALTGKQEAAAEIERLTAQCKGFAQAAMNNGQDLLLKEAEVERLTKVLTDMHDDGRCPSWLCAHIEIILGEKLLG